MPVLTISPQSVTLDGGAEQQFQAFLDGSQVTSVDWSLEPTNGVGTIHPSGLYQAPRWLIRHRKAVVIAQLKDGTRASASASLEITPAPFWTTFVGLYLFLAFAILLWIAFYNWDDLCATCPPAQARVSPPMVTLTPGRSQAFQANADAKWIGTMSPGFYTAPEADKAKPGQRVEIQATSSAGTGTAEVLLTTDFGLALQPASSIIQPGGSVDLIPVPNDVAASSAGAQPPAIEWMTPAIGTLTKLDNQAARFSVAATAAPNPKTVLILARIAGHAATAGAYVTVAPAGTTQLWVCADGGEPRVRRLLELIALMGALGALIHGISSFTIFVGNRQFGTSWAWWYFFKPFLGALVALVVFLVIRAGFGGLTDLSMSSADCLKVAAFAGLIGLFAEQATLKLKEIFDTLFTPKKDPRQDGLTNNAAPTAPKLERLDPPTFKIGSPTKDLRIYGTNFAKDCQVRIGTTALRMPTYSATMLTVKLTADDLGKADKLAVVVFNKPPSGDPSNALDLVIEQ